MSSIISLKKVSFLYDRTLVLDNVSFDIEKGAFIGVIGPNGGGKTTLLKLILGFLKPSSGDIYYFDQHQNQNKRIKSISYVPQSLQFDKQFPISVLELVLEGRLFNLPWYGKFSKADKTAALQALDLVGLPDFQHRAFGTLSGGQAQRVLIARALASEPEVLILDEPTASVDSESEAEIYRILKKLQGKVTIIMVTHNLQAAIELVNQVICVKQTVTLFSPEAICEHFALGLYHAPLIKLRD